MDRARVEENSFRNSDMSESRIGEDSFKELNEANRWQVISRELSQKQEIIHRMNKDIDDKTDSLKLTGEEITDLRKKIKVGASR